MIRHLLRIALVLSMLILSLGLVCGMKLYTETGDMYLMILSGIGLALWIPTLLLIVKYLNEEDE